MKKILAYILILSVFISFAVHAQDYPYTDPYITNFRLNINKLSILAGGHGSVSPSGENIRIAGNIIDLTIIPDAGYRIGSIKMNGIPAEYTAEGSAVKISGITNNAVINISFERGDISLHAYENRYKGYIDLSNKIYDIVFAKAEGNIQAVTEAGFEIDGRKYRIEDKFFPRFRQTKNFGIGFCDVDGIYEDKFITRPYAKLNNGDEIYGEYLTVRKSDPETYEYAEWSERTNINTYQGTEWRFLPPADYISEQNPPDFSWPYVEQAAAYDLIIAKDRDFKSVYASAYGLNVNYYNFDFVFDEDVYYYKVRFHTAEKISRWSEPRKFTIKSGAYEFPVDDIDTMLSKIPEGHPRIAVNEATETAFKALKTGESSGHYSERRSMVDEYLQNGSIQEEPETAEDFEEAYYQISSQCNDSAFIYYVDEDTAAGEYAKRVLLSMAGWDPYGASSYASNDLRFRDFIYSMAFGYTYLHDLLTGEEKQTVLSAIKTRAEILIHPTDGVMDAIFQLTNSPYQSHGASALKRLLQTAICLYGELPEAEEWLREYLPMYINFFPNWGYQDGGYSQGPGYSSNVLVDDEDLRFTLYINDIVNMYNKPFFRNFYNYLIYNIGAKGYIGAEFGDQSTGEADSAWANSANNNARMNQNRYSRWFLDNINVPMNGAFSRYYSKQFSLPTALSPARLPKSHYFKDVGWVSMLSEMNITNRLAAYFKSSSYGSHNHSHADQNSFTISRNGKQLAIDSGYYDAYGSSHYSNYYNATYAHNAITHDGGKGQATYSMIANGDVVNYLASDKFDLAAGDALNAYNYVYDSKTMGYKDSGMFDKVKRYFIYLRPETFIVIDDVKYKGNNEGNIEWWLNGWNFESITNNSAVIDNGTDSLDLKMQYPSGLTVQKYDGFVNPEGTQYNPSGKYADSPQSDRIKYTAPAANETRIVATMNVRSSAEGAKNVICEKQTDYLKLTFEDGTIAYINLKEGEFEADGIKTDALAAVVSGGEFMAVDGTFAEKDGSMLVSSDKKVSVIIADKNMSISSEYDAKVTVYGLTAQSYKDEYNNYRTNKPNDGITWENTADGTRFSLMKGSYRLK